MAVNLGKAADDIRDALSSAHSDVAGHIDIRIDRATENILVNYKGNRIYVLTRNSLSGITQAAIDEIARDIVAKSV